MSCYRFTYLITYQAKKIDFIIIKFRRFFAYLFYAVLSNVFVTCKIPLILYKVLFIKQGFWRVRTIIIVCIVYFVYFIFILIWVILGWCPSDVHCSTLLLMKNSACKQIDLEVIYFIGTYEIDRYYREVR